MKLFTKSDEENESNSNLVEGVSQVILFYNWGNEVDKEGKQTAQGHAAVSLKAKMCIKVCLTCKYVS